ncbi:MULTISPECIES: hypothetical protein [unclassified Cryobacterium]|uniref:hypothetical protein n=1 Tax=unclassified Cryobacterium TaxID=2649013 RepID=UPI00106D0538|nr:MULTISPECIES: hypothetical protein [unclassified Cryobacterium]TFC59404.1 hypothetical protein E3O68_00450 [Cryobacterium sp. TMB3-1-2]TFC67200.1 hypothetical protein E3T21_17145 [Cryobacterium sp. TMB3-15]TFC73287.1 hypothetical protein E3T22_16910 [Cryobacterium sp. TMB3-10]TFD46175.1 hypothetical protein E3T58_01545 [Cryobacterium sp. TMB3-12]
MADPLEGLDVEYGPLRMFGGGDANALGWHITEMEDWTDGVDLEVESIKIPGSDGYYDLEGTLSSRSPVIRGYALAPTLGDLGQMRDALKSVMGKPLQNLTVKQFGDTRFAPAKVDTKPRFTPQGEFPEATFSLLLHCPKPQQFGGLNGDTVATGATLTANNYGNRKGTATLTVDGNMPNGYTIAGPDGKLITVTQPVVPGSPHNLDLGGRFLRIGGVIVMGGISRFDQWAIPGGWKADMTCIPVSGSGTFGYSGRDTYV